MFPGFSPRCVISAPSASEAWPAFRVQQPPTAVAPGTQRQGSSQLPLCAFANRTHVFLPPGTLIGLPGTSQRRRPAGQISGSKVRRSGSRVPFERRKVDLLRRTSVEDKLQAETPTSRRTSLSTVQPCTRGARIASDGCTAVPAVGRHPGGRTSAERERGASGCTAGTAVSRYAGSQAGAKREQSATTPLSVFFLSLRSPRAWGFSLPRETAPHTACRKLT